MNKLTIPALSLSILMASGIAFAQTAQQPTVQQKQDSAAQTQAQPGMTVSVDAASDMVASRFVGTSVYTSDNQNVGDVNDLIFDKDGKIKGVVIGVGGFLGMGEKAVAMPLDKINVSRDENNALKLTITASRDDLDKAPTFDVSMFAPKAPPSSTMPAPTAPGTSPQQ